MNIDDISTLPELGKLAGNGKTGISKTGAGEQSSSFAKVLRNSLEQVSNLQRSADDAIRQLATGENASLHDTMIALEKADLSFRLMMQVRNKIVEAYQEIMRMPI